MIYIKKGTIIVSEYRNHRVQVFNSEGEFVFKFGSEGVNDGQLWGVKKVAINHENGDLFIVDCYNHRIQIFGVSQIDCPDNFDPNVSKKKQCLVM